MRIISFPEAHTPPGVRAQVVHLQREAWPRDADSSDGSGRGYGDGGIRDGEIGADLAIDLDPIATSHDPALTPMSLLLLDGEQVLAALDILHKEIEHDGHRYRAAGLSTVVTRLAARGQGYGGRLVAHARLVMAEEGLDVGMFSCDRPLQGFYERAGWSLVPGAVLVGGTREDPLRSDAEGFDKVVMADFFSVAAERGRASFAHSDIALYPGAIDRLW